ncbi:DUF7312 domain-containing protein [Haloprofundus salinisoli]|uniref:DUF7312 domain-containing protein n=1 Tax=Haloprofundus salinisoli TaxID=2876193 RepID=UPI001CC9378C|nr:hypothetical protein [Haloprofundus salinisoli]
MRDSHTGGGDEGETDDGESEWRFGIDDVGEDADTSDGEDADASDGESETRDETRELPPLEPESPSLENSFFVLVGVLGTLVFIFSVL